MCRGQGHRLSPPMSPPTVVYTDNRLTISGNNTSVVRSTIELYKYLYSSIRSTEDHPSAQRLFSLD